MVYSSCVPAVASGKAERIDDNHAKPLITYRSNQL